MEISTLITKIPNEKQLAFLHELLERNPEVKGQFINAFIPEIDGSQTDEEFLQEKFELLSERVMQVKISLEEIDFTPDWENYVPEHSGYIPEWEATESMSQGLIEDALSPFGSFVVHAARSGQVYDAVITIAAMYEASQEAEFLVDYEIQEPNSFAEWTVDKYSESLSIQLKNVVISSKQALRLGDDLFERYRGMNNMLRTLEPILISLVQKPEVANHFHRIIRSAEDLSSHLPQLLLKITEILGLPEKWLEYAEEFCDKNREVGKKLLDHYQGVRADLFLGAAARIFSVYPNDFGKYLLHQPETKKSTSFYKQVLKQQTHLEKNISHYKELRELLNEKEKEEFIASEKGNTGFLVQILEVEQRFPEILELARSFDQWDWYSSIDPLLSPILNIYPRECYDILEDKILHSLENNRGRSAYQQMVGWMQLMMRIKGWEREARNVLNKAFHVQPRLPALRDEMKKGGVWQEQE